MKSVTVKLKPYEVRSLMSLAYNEFWEKAKEIQDGKIERTLIPAQKSLVAELKAIWLKLAKQNKGRW